MGAAFPWRPDSAGTLWNIPPAQFGALNVRPMAHGFAQESVTLFPIGVENDSAFRDWKRAVKIYQTQHEFFVGVRQTKREV
jgi:hypothetical protein